MKVFGLTGGIGSGKSSVGRLLASQGVPVIDADVLAREAVAPGSEGLAEVIAAFGTKMLGDDGALDRPALARAVFGDEDARRRLEAIVHPRVQAAFATQVAAHAETGASAVVYEVPILFERGLEAAFAGVILVCAPEATRIARVTARDNVEADEVRARIGAQLSDEDKRPRATFIIENDGDEAHLRAQVEALLPSICSTPPIATD